MGATQLNTIAVGDPNGSSLYAWGSVNSHVLPYKSQNEVLYTPEKVDFSKLMMDREDLQIIKNQPYRIIHVEINNEATAIVLEIELPQEVKSLIEESEPIINQNNNVLTSYLFQLHTPPNNL